MNGFIPLDSIVHLRINAIDDILNDADKLFRPQNEVFEWWFWLEKRVVERWDENLPPFWINMGKLWEVCDADIVCSERSIRRLSFIVGPCLFLLWLRFGAFRLFQGWLWQRSCRVTITFRVGNCGNILWRIWSISAGSTNLKPITYIIFTWKISSTIELDRLRHLWSLEFWPLRKCIRILESTEGWFKSLSTLLRRFHVLLPIWDEAGCSCICLCPFFEHQSSVLINDHMRLPLITSILPANLCRLRSSNSRWQVLGISLEQGIYSACTHWSSTMTHPLFFPNSF